MISYLPNFTMNMLSSSSISFVLRFFAYSSTGNSSIKLYQIKVPI